MDGDERKRDGCVFCRISAGTEASSIVYEDENVVAFLDFMPINPGHTLIIPRRHATDLAELEPAAGARVFETAQRVAAWIRASSIACDGINLILNDGAPAGQRVFHTHLHVIPRVSGDRLSRATDTLPSTREDLDSVASAIRKVSAPQPR